MTKLRSVHIVFARLAVLIAVCMVCRPASTDPLNVAPGSDPGGTAVAVITAPFPLDAASISEHLARDGEGVAIGWDFSKQSESSDTDTRVQSTLAIPQVITALTAGSQIESRNTRLVPAFVDRLQPNSIAQAVAFVARTPARLVVIPSASDTASDWVAFRAAAEHFPDLLFIVPAQSSDHNAGDKNEPGQALGYPAKFHLSNVLSVSASAMPDADVVLALPPAASDVAPEVALAITVKALLWCPSTHEMSLPAMSKLEAMAKLATLGGPSQSNNQQARPDTELGSQPAPGSQPITPCAEALN